MAIAKMMLVEGGHELKMCQRSGRGIQKIDVASHCITNTFQYAFCIANTTLDTCLELSVKGAPKRCIA